MDNVSLAAFLSVCVGNVMKAAYWKATRLRLQTVSNRSEDVPL